MINFFLKWVVFNNMNKIVMKCTYLPFHTK